MPESQYFWKGSSDEPVSFTDAGDLSGISKPSGEQVMGSAEQEQKSQDKGPIGSAESVEKRESKKKTKRRKKKTRKSKYKRKKDRYEPQNFLLRIEGTLCCASLVIAFIWAASMFIFLVACLVWANFDLSATIESAAQARAS